MSNPVDEYLSKQKTAAEEDLEAWKSWKTQPSPQALSPLLHRFDPEMNRAMFKFRARNVNEQAMRAHLTRQAMDALETFDPDRGASLRTHVTNRLQRAYRFNAQNQNLAYIPEGSARHIGKIETARGQLLDSLGREPTEHELAQRAGMSLPQLQRVQGMRRGDVLSTGQTNPTGYSTTNQAQVAQLLPTTLAGPERALHEYLTGTGGKPQLTNNADIGKRLGLSPTAVHSMRVRLEKTYRGSFGG